MSQVLTEDTHALALLARLAAGMDSILHELRRPAEWGGAGELVRVRWDPAGPGGPGRPDLSGEFDYSGNFEAVGIFNLSAGVINVAFTPEASRNDGTTVLTLGARGFIILPYKGVTVSVSGAVAGSALIVAFDTPQPANAGTF